MTCLLGAGTQNTAKIGLVCIEKFDSTWSVACQLTHCSCETDIDIHPASSVDAERAFSSGRLQVGYLQHGMNSQTFKARVALGSWVNTPLLPDDLPAKTLQNTSSKNSKKKKVESEELVVVDSDDSDTTEY
jgi:hypothetical protein